MAMGPLLLGFVSFLASYVVSSIAVLLAALLKTRLPGKASTRRPSLERVEAEEEEAEDGPPAQLRSASGRNSWADRPASDDVAASRAGTIIFVEEECSYEVGTPGLLV
mmetsp:Transcript_78073/g.226532  ORF Transcript_78073/g.226532 Transcript_78073/m.226532 type:complete len:108 (-) Transcript_78073:111-434(-)